MIVLSDAWTYSETRLKTPNWRAALISLCAGFGACQAGLAIPDRQSITPAANSKLSGTATDPLKDGQTCASLVTALTPGTGNAKVLSPEREVIAAMSEELGRSLSQLKNAGSAPLYYLAYRVYDSPWQRISASNGAVLEEYIDNYSRMLSVDLRVGSPKFDNTHFLRGKNSAAAHFYSKSTADDSILPGRGAGLPLRQCLWLKTDQAFKGAQQRYAELGASNDVLAAEEDESGDFSLQPTHEYFSQIKTIALNRDEYEPRARKLSEIFSQHPLIEHATVSFSAEPTTRYIVNSEGSQMVEQHLSYQFNSTASTLAEDGMNLWLWDSVEANDPALLPDDAALKQRIDKLADKLDQLRTAPVADSYVGPAILSGKAAAVFFHETFGHRIEAEHEKNENEGKTFARKIGTVVMPSFISVVDDPTAETAYGTHLSGHYLYDDEGVPAQAVTLAKKGVLTNFLMSRVPVQGFGASNGHGRSSPGWNPIARQANLMVVVDKNKQVSPAVLRKMLIAQAKKQHKQYGLLFDEIAGGSTYTTSESNQTYFVNPLVVYKVFVDGRPDQLIRGADIVGTPLSALERIIGAGNDYGVFNGECGRDSGPVAVSAVAPSLLVQSIEIKRTAKTSNKPPILANPNSLKEDRAENQKRSQTGATP